MQYYLETETIRHDGPHVIWRKKAASNQDALNLAYSVGCEMFGEEWANTIDWKSGDIPCMVNDYYKRIQLRVVGYSAQAQVSEGLFAL